MPAYGLKSTVAQALLKASAGLAPAGGFEYRLTDAEAPVLQAKQVDTADHDVAPQVLRPQRMVFGSIHQRTDDGQMFPLDKRPLARIARARAGVIAGQPGLATHLDGVQLDHLAARLRAHTDPPHPAALRHVGAQFLQWTHKLIPTSNTTLRPRLVRKKSGASGWANNTRAKVGPTSDSDRQP